MAFNQVHAVGVGCVRGWLLCAGEGVELSLSVASILVTLEGISSVDITEVQFTKNKTSDFVSGYNVRLRISYQPNPVDQHPFIS